MMAFQEKFVFIPLHQLVFHNSISKELIYYASVEELSANLAFQHRTLVTITEKSSFELFNEVDHVLNLVQNQNFVGLLLSTNKKIELNKEVLDILSSCKIPVVQIKNDSFLQVFYQENEWLSQYNYISAELSECTAAGTNQMAEQLACLFETPLLFLDQQFCVSCQIGTPELIEQANKWLDEHQKELIINYKPSSQKQNIHSLGNYMLFPMHISNALTYTILVEKHLVSWQRQLIHKLACIATLKNQTKLQIKNKMEHFKEHFIHNLLFNNVTSLSVLTRQGEGLGWNLKSPHHLFVIDIQQKEELISNTAWINKVKMHFKMSRDQLQIEMILFKFQNQLILLLEDEEERTHLERKNYSLHVAEKLYTFAQTEWPELNLRIGIGNFYPRADQLHKSYQEAKLAIQFMLDWLPNRQVCHITDLGIYRLLLYVPKEILYDFYLETLTPLIESDKEQATDYIKTLQSFYLKQGKLNDVAEELYVHPNTLRNRIKKIEDVTGLNIQEPEGCINLNIATRIMSFISAQQ